ncbi:MAG TPA: 6-bladed beta-propeller [Bacteroidales bacterium]|nr:6-bladed beta-propeller [Bacteroidales bacterium]
MTLPKHRCFLLNTLIFLCAGFLMSCNFSDTSSKSTVETYYNDSGPVNLKIEKPHSIRSLMLSDLVDSITYIVPETKRESLIKNISSLSQQERIQFSGNYIFIASGQELFQFERNGKFVRKIGQNGKGPGEYVLRLFETDEANQKVYIYSNFTHTILAYDVNGRFLSEVKDPSLYHTHYLFTTGNGDFTLGYDNGMGNVDYRMLTIDQQGKIKKKFGNPDKHTYGNYNLLNGETILYNFGGVVHYKYYFNDTVFAINKQNELEPRYVINLDSYRIPVSDRANYGNKNIFLGKIYIWAIKEFDKYLFIKYSYNDEESYLALYNKETHSFYPHCDNIIQNDIDGGMNIASESEIHYLDDTHIFICVEASSLLEHCHSKAFVDYNSNAKKQLERVVKSIDENSNPVIMVMKLK